MALTGAKGSTADQIRAGLALPADEHLLAGMSFKFFRPKVAQSQKTDNI